MKSVKPVDYSDDGRMDYNTLNTNFIRLEEDIQLLRQELNSIGGQMNISALSSKEGYSTVVPGEDHPSMVLKSGYIVAGDNVKENIECVILAENEETQIGRAIIKATEKAGKAQEILVTRGIIVQHMEDIYVKTDNRRKLLVNLTFEVHR